MALRAFADGSVFGEMYGETPPRVLALHGWGRRGSDFAEVLAGMDALVPDLPGFGASPPPPTPVGARGYAAAIEPLLATFEEPAIVLGHSFGGRVAVCLADAYPERVGRLVLTGVPLLRAGKPRRPSAAYRVLRALHRAGLLSDRRLEYERQRRGSADYRAATGVMRDVLVIAVNETYEAELGRIQCGMDLVWGSDDHEVPLAVAERTMALRGGHQLETTLTVLDDIGHHAPIEAPGALRAALERSSRP